MLQRLPSIIERVARHYWGEPNTHLSKGKNLRFGTHGSKSVDLSKGTWYDHERCIGGGVVDLIRDAEGDSADVATILEQQFGIPKDAPPVTTEEIFDYRDLTGETQYQVIRLDRWTGLGEWQGKTYRQRRVDPTAPGGYAWTMLGVTALPYRLLDVHDTPTNRPVFIVEGERCADAVTRLGFTATCNHGGAGKWYSSLNEHFVDRHVIIIPDEDAAGERHIKAVGDALTGTAKSIRVLRLPRTGRKGYDVVNWIDEGGTREQLLELAKAAPHYNAATTDLAATQDDEQQQTQPTAPKVTLIPWGALPDQQVQWLIPDLIPMQGFVALYGKPGTYKSFVALYTAAMVATGRPCFDREPHKGSVVYIAGEGGAGLKQRRDALMKHYGLDASTNVHFVRAQLNLRSTDEDTDALIAAIQDADLRPVLVIVDTLARAFAGGNENSSEDMGAFIRHCGRIQETLHTALMIVHHSGKDEAKGQRGHSSLLGAVDTELEVTKLTEDDAPDDAPRIGQMHVTKQKDGEDGFKVTYRMETVTLSAAGLDEERTSLVVVPDDAQGTTKPPAAQAARKQRMGDNARIVLAAINTAVEDKGRTGVVADMPASLPMVMEGTARTYAEAALPQGDAKRKNEALDRALSWLIANDKIGKTGTWIWVK